MILPASAMPPRRSWKFDALFSRSMQVRGFLSLLGSNATISRQWLFFSVTPGSRGNPISKRVHTQSLQIVYRCTRMDRIYKLNLKSVHPMFRVVSGFGRKAFLGRHLKARQRKALASASHFRSSAIICKACICDSALWFAIVGSRCLFGVLHKCRCSERQ